MSSMSTASAVAPAPVAIAPAVQAAGFPQLTYNGRPVNMDADHFGLLTESTHLLHDPAALRTRMADDGYLFLRGLLNRDDVLAARLAILERVATSGALDPRYPVAAGIENPDRPTGWIANIARDCQPLHHVLYGDAMMGFFDGYFGEPTRHYDYTWFRTKTSHVGVATQPHYDVVYMGRGEVARAHTVWTPIGDVTPAMGGLVVLEGSHKHAALRESYGKLDVDSSCQSGLKPKWQFGAYASDIFAPQVELGGRWLSADYRAGDVLIFSFYLMHASTDNLTKTMRLSADSRYQVARGEIDDRWFGAEPIGHGEKAHRELVC